MVTPSYPPNIGGLEGHVSGLASALAKAGVQVTILTQATRSEQFKEASGVEIRAFSSLIRGRTYRVAPSLGFWLAAHRTDFDLVHAHSYHGAAAAMGALAASDVPLVLTPHYHGGGHTAFARVLHLGYRPLGTWLINRAAAIVCVSKAEALALSKRDSAAQSRTVVIPNAPATTALSDGLPCRRSPLVVSLGRLAPYKNNRLLIDSFRLLDLQAQLVVVGDGPQRAALAAAAKNDPRIQVVGYLERAALDRLLLAAWVVASLSEHEAFGMGLLEGLLAGARVVASDIPPHREVVELCHANDRASFLPLPASPAVVATSLLAALSAGVPRSSVPRWTWDNVAQKTLELYEQVSHYGPKAPH